MAASVFHLVKTGNFSISEAKTCPKIKLTQLKWKKQVIMKDHLIWTKILKIRRIHLLQVSILSKGFMNVCIGNKKTLIQEKEI